MWPTPVAGDAHLSSKERGGAEKNKRSSEGNIKPSRAIRNVADTDSFRREKVGGRDQSDEKKSGCGGDHEGRGGENARRKPHSQENETLDS